MRQNALLKVIQGWSADFGSIRAAADRANRSVFHVHRTVRGLLGETPKQYALRQQLARASCELLVSDRPISLIAEAAGFRSHAVFTRAFYRRFGMSPHGYRMRSRSVASAREWTRHARILPQASPCIRLFHLPTHLRPRPDAMPLTVTRKTFPGQPVLLIRRRIARSELPQMLAECFGTLFGHGQRSALPIAGWPLARYIAMGPGLWTVEAAMPLASAAPAEGDMQPGTLPAGPAAFAVHVGAYEQLSETHAAIERWIEAQGYRVSGAPWESYVTDPAQHPNPADWRTEVYWPLA